MAEVEGLSFVRTGRRQSCVSFTLVITAPISAQHLLIPAMIQPTRVYPLFSQSVVPITWDDQDYSPVHGPLSV